MVKHKITGFLILAVALVFWLFVRAHAPSVALGDGARFAVAEFYLLQVCAAVLAFAGVAAICKRIGPG